MQESLFENATAVWAILSGLAVASLGLSSLIGRGSRPPGTAAFAAFATCWAAQIIAGQWMAYADEYATVAHLLYLTFLIPLPYFLLEFASAYTRHAGATLAWRALRAAVVTLAAVAVTLLIMIPNTLYLGAQVTPDGTYARWGPLFVWLAMVPFFASLGIALYTLEQARRDARSSRTALPYALLAGGLAAFTSFSAGNNLAYYLADLVVAGREPFAEPYFLLFAALSILVVTIGLRALVASRRAASRALSKPALIVAVATLVPFAWGTLEGGLAYDILPKFNTVGLWRLGGVALLTYALARWRDPDLPHHARRGAATTAGIAGAAVAGGLTAGVALLVLPGTLAPLVVGGLVPVATLAPSVRLAQRILVQAEEPKNDDTDLSRRVETYRAALEASVGRESLDEDTAFLAGLRTRLQLSDDVHAALLTIARSTVLPRNDEPFSAYERLRLLGEGTQGRAWLARRRADDELVVVKESFAEDPGSARALLRQARLLQAIRHPNLVRLHEAREEPRGVLLVMDYVDGGSLADRLANGPLPAHDAVGITREVLSGLEALHQRGIVHGDIKAANVLRQRTGETKLGDFGMARAFQPDATRTHLPCGGTLSAIAPEQLTVPDAYAPATPQADVYAAGALLYRLLTGEHYVDITNVPEAEARERILRLAPRLPHTSVPAQLEVVLRRALAKDPKDRYASASAMRRALEDAS